MFCSIAAFAAFVAGAPVAGSIVIAVNAGIASPSAFAAIMSGAGWVSGAGKAGTSDCNAVVSACDSGVGTCGSIFGINSLDNCIGGMPTCSNNSLPMLSRLAAIIECSVSGLVARS